MLAVVSAYLKHNQKKYYFTDSVLCNISSKKEGHKYAEELFSPDQNWNVH